METVRVGNPRRVPAMNSVCVKKSPSYGSSTSVSVTSNLAAAAVGGEEEATGHHRREHSQAAESAKTWFDDSNKNVVSSEVGSKFYAGEKISMFCIFMEELQ